MRGDVSFTFLHRVEEVEQNIEDERWQSETEQAVRTAEEATAIKDEIRDHINTIHLYASLSEEESHSASVKEKQKDIIRLSEIILHKIYK